MRSIMWNQLHEVHIHHWTLDIPGHPWTILDHPGLSWTILDIPGSSWSWFHDVSRCFRMFPGHLDQLWPATHFARLQMLPILAASAASAADVTWVLGSGGASCDLTCVSRSGCSEDAWPKTDAEPLGHRLLNQYMYEPQWCSVRGRCCRCWVIYCKSIHTPYILLFIYWTAQIGPLIWIDLARGWGAATLKDQFNRSSLSRRYMTLLAVSRDVDSKHSIEMRPDAWHEMLRSMLFSWRCSTVFEAFPLLLLQKCPSLSPVPKLDLDKAATLKDRTTRISRIVLKELLQPKR